MDEDVGPRIRKNVVFAEEVKKRGEIMADLDHRNFSQEMEWLIDQEWQRRGLSDREEKPHVAFPVVAH